MKFSFKKFLLVTFILIECTTLAVFSSVESCTPPVTEGIFLRPRVTITFTIARRRDCEGFGICDWQIEITMLRANSCTATLTTDDTNRNNLVLEIDKSKGVLPETYSRYFQSGTFLMEDESPVPAEILKQLGIPGPRTLLAGKHKTTEKNGIIYVSIPTR